MVISLILNIPPPPPSLSSSLLPISTSSGAKVNPSHEPVLTETTAPRWEVNFEAVVEAVAPCVYIAARAFSAWVWRCRYKEKAKPTLMAWWILLCFLATSSQALDGLITENTWATGLVLGKLVGTKIWIALLSLLNLAGGAGLLLVDMSIMAVVGGYLLTIAAVVCICSNDQPGLEAEEPQVRYNLERRHLRHSPSLESQN